MDIQKTKSILKEKKITYEQLATLSGVPLQTIQKIFSGHTKHPRIDTVQAIEKALGLDKNFMSDISAEEKELIKLIKQLDDEQTNELSNFVDYLLSKRK